MSNGRPIREMQISVTHMEISEPSATPASRRTCTRSRDAYGKCKRVSRAYRGARMREGRLLQVLTRGLHVAAHTGNAYVEWSGKSHTCTPPGHVTHAGSAHVERGAHAGNAYVERGPPTREMYTRTACARTA